jgi:hypothetical protein
MAASSLLECATAVVAPQYGPQAGWQPSGATSGTPQFANWNVVPRCTIQFEKTPDGCKIKCKCDDEVACGALQNLCRMLCEGCCSCCCCKNGVCVCQCSFAFAHCKCENTKDGCTISCTSGDKECCDQIQACCACLEKCCKNGCCCYVCFNGTPVCCGTC